MEKNRITPFGYMIQSGKLKINPNERNIVIEIFDRYSNGESYKKIAEWLTSKNVLYIENKSIWNKNMVARILQNENYLGNEKYPSIVSKDQFLKAEKNKKTFTKTENEDIKTLKPLIVCSKCGAPLKRRLKSSGGERWYCSNDISHISTILNDKTILTSVYELQNKLNKFYINEIEKNTIDNDKTIMLSNQINMSLKDINPNSDILMENIFQLAVEKYNNIKIDFNIANNIQNKINELSHNHLESKKLCDIVKQIAFSDINIEYLILINNQKLTI